MDNSMRVFRTSRKYFTKSHTYCATYENSSYTQTESNIPNRPTTNRKMCLRKGREQLPVNNRTLLFSPFIATRKISMGRKEVYHGSRRIYHSWIDPGLSCSNITQLCSLPKIRKEDKQSQPSLNFLHSRTLELALSFTLLRCGESWPPDFLSWSFFSVDSID